MVALAILTTCSRPAPQVPAAPAKPATWGLRADGRLHVSHLDNGLTVALIPDPRGNLVEVDLVVQAGDADDPAGRAGLAHLAAHVTALARSTPGAPTLGDALASVATGAHVRTTLDSTAFGAWGFSPQLAGIIDAQARHLEVACDQVDDEAFAHERGIVNIERSGQLLHIPSMDAVNLGAWGTGHPYVQPYDRQIADATRAETCGFLDDHYAPERATVVVFGNFDSKSAEALVRARFGHVARKSPRARAPVDAYALGGTKTELTAGIPQTTVFVYFPAPSVESDDDILYSLLIEYLKDHLQEVAKRENWIAKSDVTTLGDGRARRLTIEVAVTSDAYVDDAAAFARKAVSDLGPQFPFEHFDRKRTELVAKLARRYDEEDGLGEWIAQSISNAPNRTFFFDSIERIAATNGADLGQWADQWFKRVGSHVVVLRSSGELGPPVYFLDAQDGEEKIEGHAPVDISEAQRKPTTPASAVQPRVHERVLANGLRVWLAPDPNSVMVDIRLVFPVGADAEGPTDIGLATRAAEDLDDPKPQQANAAGRDATESAFDAGTEIREEVTGGSTEFEVSGLAASAASHVWRLWHRLDAGVYPDGVRRAPKHYPRMAFDAALGRTAALGADAFDAKFPATDLQRFRATRYVAHGATLIVAGGFDEAAMLKDIENLFGTWRGDAQPPLPRFEPPPVAGPLWISAQDRRPVRRVSIGFGGLDEDPAKTGARAILDEMLRNTVDSAHDHSVDVFGHALVFRDRATVRILAVGEMGDPGATTGAVLAALDRLRGDRSAWAADFVRARRRALAMALKDDGTRPADYLELVAEGRIVHGRPLADAIVAATQEDVAAVAARDLDPQRRVVMIEGRDAVVALTAAGAPANAIVHAQR
jgi:zinc protease